METSMRNLFREEGLGRNGRYGLFFLLAEIQVNGGSTGGKEQERIPV